MRKVNTVVNSILSGGSVRRVLLESLGFVLANEYPYNSKQMKVSKTVYDRLIKDWQDALDDSETEEDIV